jgi:stage III sporulation protein SpoIIIAA
MINSISTTNFTTTDGLSITINQYDLYSTYSIIDQEAKTYVVTIRKVGKQFAVLPHFNYEGSANDGYYTYSDNERKKGHYGTITMIKTVSNIDEAELLSIDTVRHIAKLSNPLITSLNEIQNTILQIKSKPNSDKIPTLLEEIQIQLNYLKRKFC